MKFYTSDLHFDHSNMLEHEHRPWANVESMNEGLLYRINGRVRLDDELYILGDFTLRSTRSAVEKFRNGIICNHVHLITGNHDYFAKKEWAKELFETVQPYKEIHDEGHKIVLCHYPIMYWNGMDEGAIHLYGHMHSRKGMQHPHKDAHNVGVDVNDWYPVTLKDIFKRKGKKMRGKNLARRTIAPRLSELITEAYDLLKEVHPDTKNFALLVSSEGKEIKTRILPLTSKTMDELYEASNNNVKYVAHTDGEHNFTRGEEK